MSYFLKRFILLFSLLCLGLITFAQKPVFTDVYSVYTTGCKNQARSSTCWSFATTSFIESELYRITGKTLDISEMFFVRYIYPEKAANYMRWHGNVFFTPGGQPHDVMNMVRNYGFVPRSVYNGSGNNRSLPDHAELDTMMSVMTHAAAKNDGSGSCGYWLDAVGLVLDGYLGQVPATFINSGKEYTSISFAHSAGFDPDDYIEITSYSHHPYYCSFVLETKYNWSHAAYYNIPFNDFSALFEDALKAGFSLVYNGDVSENEFSPDAGMAVLPIKKWNEKTAVEQGNTFTGTEPEIIPDAAIRQQMFDNGSTTVDHVMHIKGMVKDATGKKYYVVKNSWGDPSANGGVIYMSECYLLLKCVSVMVNKNALKPEIRKKAGIE